MEPITPDSPSVQSYLSILQGVINRMASNSASCKTWCLGLVSAIIVIVAEQGRQEFVWISMLPIVLFFGLDAYYLCLERNFRDRYVEFIEKLHLGRATAKDLFIVSPGTGAGSLFAGTRRAVGSVAVWPFYTLLSAMLVLIRFWLLRSHCS